jgi:hypothetical protein
VLPRQQEQGWMTQSFTGDDYRRKLDQLGTRPDDENCRRNGGA